MPGMSALPAIFQTLCQLVSVLPASPSPSELMESE